MPEVKLNAQKPASVTSRDPVTFYLPTADVVLNDDGEVINPGVDALEEQRKQMEQTEQAAQERAEEGKDVELAEKKEKMHTASQRAEKSGKSVKEEFEALEEKQEEDEKFVEELTGVKQEKKVAVTKDEPKPRSVVAGKTHEAPSVAEQAADDKPKAGRTAKQVKQESEAAKDEKK